MWHLNLVLLIKLILKNQHFLLGHFNFVFKFKCMDLTSSKYDACDF